MESSAENADSHSYVVGNGISTFKAILLIFLEGASRSPENCLADSKRTADPSLRTIGIACQIFVVQYIRKQQLNVVGVLMRYTVVSVFCV